MSKMTARGCYLSMSPQCTCPAENMVCYTSSCVVYTCVHLRSYSVACMRLCYIQSHSGDGHVHATAPCSACALAQAHPTISCIHLLFQIKWHCCGVAMVTHSALSSYSLALLPGTCCHLSNTDSSPPTNLETSEYK